MHNTPMVSSAAGTQGSREFTSTSGNCWTFCHSAGFDKSPRQNTLLRGFCDGQHNVSCGCRAVGNLISLACRDKDWLCKHWQGVGSSRTRVDYSDYSLKLFFIFLPSRFVIHRYLELKKKSPSERASCQKRVVLIGGKVPFHGVHLLCWANLMNTRWPHWPEESVGCAWGTSLNLNVNLPQTLCFFVPAGSFSIRQCEDYHQAHQQCGKGHSYLPWRSAGFVRFSSCAHAVSRLYLHLTFVKFTKKYVSQDMRYNPV